MTSFGVGNDVSRSGRTARIATIMAVVATLVIGVAALPAAALAPTTVNPALWQVNGRVRAIIETPAATYIAGDFTALVSPDGSVSVPHANLAAIDPASGQPLPFYADVNKPVWNIAVSADNKTVYAVGDFSLANGKSRKRAAAFTAYDGVTAQTPATPPLAWTANLDATGYAIAVLGSSVYLGGDFLTVNSASHAHLAAVDATTGALRTSFLATTDAAVESIVPTHDGSKVFIGGLFTGVSPGTGGTAQHKIAALNPTTGAFDPSWKSHPTFEVFKLEVSDTQLFAAAGGSGGHAMGYDLATGTQQWATFGDGDAVAAELQNGILYLGGHMTKWNGVDTGHVFAVNPATGALLLTAGKPSWTIKINSNLGVFAMDSFNGHLSVGGDFTKVNNLSQLHYARFDEVLDHTAPTTPGQPTASGVVGAASNVNVVWGASTDNVASSLIYSVFRDGNLIGSVTSSSTTTVSYTDTALAPGSTHTWTVQSSDGANLSAMSPVSNAFTLPAANVPTLSGLTMLDNDDDGKVDAVRATFSSTVSCQDPCTSPWTLSAVPSGGSLASVAVSGNTATLSLNEGSGAQDTSVGAFTVALAASASGIVDAGGSEPSSFTATAPADGAGPVPVSYSTTSLVTAGFMEPGDTFSVVFSEPIDPTTVVAANVKEFDPKGVGTDQINIVGLSATLDLLDDSIIVPDKGTIVYQKSTLTLSNGNRTIQSTIAGKCTGTACDASARGVASAQPVKFIPEVNLTDVAGNAAGGSYTGTLAIY